MKHTSSKFMQWIVACLLLGCGEAAVPSPNATVDQARNPSELVLQGDEQVPELESMTAVAVVNIERYLGTWYEMASIPSWFQNYCRAGVRAQYALEISGTVEVRNSCIDASEVRNELVGRAAIYNPEASSKLQVAFFGLDPAELEPNYWILYLDEDYSLAVVGEPERNFGWILSRNPAITQNQLDTAATILLQNGYELDDFELTDQQFYIDGRETTTVVSYQ